jgi:phage repressor protein C with HTH and peptisase S24 domain
MAETSYADAPSEVHERLAWLRRRAGFESAADFAKAIGIHSTTYRAYENGQNGFAKLAPTIARALDCSVEFLLEGRESTPKPKPQAPPRKQIVMSDLPPVKGASDGDGAITIRAVDLSYAMGDGTNLDDYFEETGVQFDPNFIRTITRAPSNALFVARGDGDSMFPTLINDDQVLIDTSQRRLNQQDRIWACSLHGAGMIKRLRLVDQDRVEVRSDNPAIGTLEVSTRDLHIVGRVIWVGRRV